MRGYEIFKKIWEEIKDGKKFKDHPLANFEFEESKRKEV